MKALISGKYSNLKKKRIFSGREYKLYSYHYDKAFAKNEVKELRSMGKNARIVPAGANKRGWNVYSNKKSK